MNFRMKANGVWQTVMHPVNSYRHAKANSTVRQEALVEQVRREQQGAAAAPQGAAQEQVATPQGPQTMGPQGGHEQSKSGSITAFNLAFVSAVTCGYKRADEQATSDVDIRSVLCSQPFIHAVSAATAESPIATPIEEIDRAYAESMNKIRKTLAAKLQGGRIDGLAVE
ncbi:MAG: hypothetical protein PHV13_02675, partial [Candidatus ainarchaeum sp.]|nr:hypothetical protein [Candidatus ainarchaeum sp.]